MKLRVYCIPKGPEGEGLVLYWYEMNKRREKEKKEEKERKEKKEEKKKKKREREKKEEKKTYLLNLLPLPLQIHLLRRIPPRPLDHLPPHKQHGKQKHHKITKQKRLHLPKPRQKNCIPPHNRHHSRPHQSIHSHIWLSPSFVRQSFSLDALSVESAIPHEKSKTHDREIDQLRSSDEINEPTQNFRRSGRYRQKRQQANCQYSENASIRNSDTICFSENFGGFSFESEAEETAGGAIHVRISCGER